jgi:hypothetical protein
VPASVVAGGVVAGGGAPVAGGGVSVDCAGGTCWVEGAGWPVSGAWVGGAGWGVPPLAGGAGDAGGAEDGVGADEAGAGVLLTPGAGIVAGLSEEDSPIATAIPTSSTATAVLISTTAGSRYHGMTGGSFSGTGRVSRSNFSAGRAPV